MNPYLTLGVPRDADDSRIRQAYLDAVKQAPPDTHPERFQSVNAAYELVKDEPHRIDHYLFRQDCDGLTPLDAFLHFARIHGRPQPPPIETLKEMLRTCSKI